MTVTPQASTKPRSYFARFTTGRTATPSEVPDMRLAALLPAFLLGVVACSTSAPTASPPGTSPDPGASSSGSALPSVPPTTPPASSSPEAPPTTTPTMTPEEEALMGALRIEAAVNCVPRRIDLPAGALRGIECRPDYSLVARVGVFAFRSEADAAYAYMTRMAAAGVDVNAGDCANDVPGERAWMPGDGEGDITDPGVFNWENTVLAPGRIGCFLDENGTANVRVTCGEYYIGVLGDQTDLSDLDAWAWAFPAGYEPGTYDPPGICIGDGLPGPDAP